MLTALAVVIALMIGAMVVLKKYFYQSPSSRSGNDMIHIISTCHLSPKNSLLLADVLGQFILLGISNHQMSILGTITDPEAINNLKNHKFVQRSAPLNDTFTHYKSLLRNINPLKRGK
jgi:flagellar biosynthetic protein FliO